jgi:hypothetical protein
MFSSRRRPNTTMFSSRRRTAPPSQPFDHEIFDVEGFAIVVAFTAHEFEQAESDFAEATRRSLESFEAESLATKLAEQKLAEAKQKLAEAEQKLAKADWAIRQSIESTRLAERKERLRAAEDALVRMASEGQPERSERMMSRLLDHGSLECGSTDYACLPLCFSVLTGLPLDVLRDISGLKVGEMGEGRHLERLCAVLEMRCTLRHYSPDWTGMTPEVFGEQHTDKVELCFRDEHFTIYVGDEV